MPDIIKASFAAGEITSSLFGRVDQDKYQVGAAVMRNFFVDFRGGASTRPGTEHVGVGRIAPPEWKPRLLPFIFNSEQAYALELAHLYMRIIYQGRYVTEAAFNIASLSQSAFASINVPGHNFVVGNVIEVLWTTGGTRPNGVPGLTGRRFYVGNVVGNDITIYTEGANEQYVQVDAATWSAVTAGQVARVYEVATPWTAEDLFGLNYTQSADVMTLTHPDYPPHDIRRLAFANWQIVRQTYGASLAAPSATATPINYDGNKPLYFYAYAVTAVDADGRESQPTVATCSHNALNQNSEPNIVVRVAWSIVPGATKYRIYKASPVPLGEQNGGPFVFGLIASEFSNSTVDVNFSPEFDQSPPQARNPFLDGALASAAIVFSGQGYVAPYAVISDATGAGAVVALGSDLSATASPYGELTAANVVNGGTGYTAPSAAVFDAAPLGSGVVLGFTGAWVATPGGTGFVPAPGSIFVAWGGANYHQASYTGFVEAVATANAIGTNKLPISLTAQNGRIVSVSWAAGGITPTPLTGLSSVGSGTLTFTVVGTDTPASGGSVSLTIGGNTNPATVAYFEQRRVFGGSRARPATVWMSRPGQFTNFDVSDPSQDDDAITASLYAQEVNIINALVPVTSGLMALTSGGAYLLSAGGNQNPVTPSTIKAPPQAFSGAQALAPLRIGEQVLYTQARGSGVRDLAFNFYSNSFAGQDVSVLSGHLLEGRTITQWCHAQEPHKLVWAVRDDGVLLSFTYLKEQEVYGWARHDTAGEVVSVCSIPEGREDAVYLVVRRWCEGRGFFFHTERMASRLFGANPAGQIAAQSEEAWCVDAGARLVPYAPPTAIKSAQVISGPGAIYSVQVVLPGAGYAGAIDVRVDDPTGSGATFYVTLNSGGVASVSVLTSGAGYTNPSIVITGAEGDGAVLAAKVVTGVLVTTEGGAFNPGDEGKVLRVRGGKGDVLEYLSPTTALVDFYTQPPAWLPNTPFGTYVLGRVLAGEWSLAWPVWTLGGLDHLEGSLVQVVADGSVQTPKRVVDGSVTLDSPASTAIVGLGFTAQLQTPRLETKAGGTSQGKKKTMTQAIVRVKDARGLFVGQEWDRLVEVKQRRDEAAGAPISMQTGGQVLAPAYDGAPAAFAPLGYEDQKVSLIGGWTEDGQVCIQQSYPMPATVLAVVLPTLNEDDK